MSDPSQLTERLFNDEDTEQINPFELFELWLAEATVSEINDPNAMTMATLDENGMPDARIVLMNGRDERGLVFFTNLESAKAAQLRAHAKATLLFHWKSLRRQVRFRGSVAQVSDAEADDYFATRPRGSQIGAHASRQSAPLATRGELVERVAKVTARFEGRDVPRPDNWSGFRLMPATIEFWKNGEFRLHDRVVFEKHGNGWQRHRLNP